MACLARPPALTLFSAGVSGNISADYQTLQGMYAQDHNNISDDPNAKAYAQAFANEARKAGYDNQADKAEAAITGQRDVDFHGGAIADAENKLSGNLSDVKAALDKSDPQAGKDFQTALDNNDYRDAQRILKDVYGGNENLSTKFLDSDFDKGIQSLEIKSFNYDAGKGKEANNDLKKFEQEGGTKDQFQDLTAAQYRTYG